MLRFVSDPGHGWLEVPMATLRYLGIESKITIYSYRKEDMVYLEEDCDAPTFIDAYRNRYGARPAWKEIFEENTPIRSYPRYNG
jgi:hypothetical protein